MQLLQISQVGECRQQTIFTLNLEKDIFIIFCPGLINGLILQPVHMDSWVELSLGTSKCKLNASPIPGEACKETTH